MRKKKTRKTPEDVSCLTSLPGGSCLFSHTTHITGCRLGQRRHSLPSVCATDKSLLAHPLVRALKVKVNITWKHHSYLLS